MTDVEDVAQLLADFEVHNQVRLTVAFSVTGVGKNQTLAMMMSAFEPDGGSGEAKLLGSASVRCSDLNVRSLGAALTRLMYLVDSQLAWDAMGKNCAPRA